MRSNIEVISKGKGVYAPGFKTGIYTDFSEKPGKAGITWDKQSKEYEIQTNPVKRCVTLEKSNHEENEGKCLY